MGIFISAEKTAECVVIAVFIASAMLVSGFKILSVLQSCGYGGKKLLKWCARKNNMTYSRLCLLCLAQALSCAVIGLCFSFTGFWAGIISLAAYLIFYPLYIYADNKVALRCPASLTPRFKRLLAVCWLVFAIIAYFAVTLLNFADFVWGNAAFSYLRYVPLAVLPVLLPALCCLGNLITKIYETPKNRTYIRRAKAKLAGSEIKVIGITGSYGKTSVKNILSAMLSEKYKVLATPRSYNTPIGVALTVNSSDLGAYDYLVAEMGARNRGDIAELCDICPPEYSIITGICPQHIETFKTLDNIISAKGEILLATKKKAYVAPDAAEYFKNYSVDKADCDCVKDVVADCTGTEFTLCLGIEERRVKCKLLGAHSAKNIGLCASLAYDLGVPFDDICKAVEKLGFVEHRLQLIENNGVYILDDGYNSNVVGAAAAVETLKTFGGRKIAVTPGLVELGVLDEKENAALGEKLVGLDKVILVGETLVGYVLDGYLAAGGDKEKIVKAESLAAAQDILKDYLQKGDAVLFLNDLPDIYN